jgi:hypothetical protein
MDSDDEVPGHIVKLRKIDRNLGGPYEVQLSKPYKPIFIVWADLMFAIINLTVGLIAIIVSFERGANFATNGKDLIPGTYTMLLLCFFVKFFYDLLVLQFLTKKRDTNMNHSASTSKLFGWRIGYDFVITMLMMFVFSKHGQHVHSDAKTEEDLE